MRIVEFINQNGKITNRNIRGMFKISDRAALIDVHPWLHAILSIVTYVTIEDVTYCREKRSG